MKIPKYSRNNKNISIAFGLIGIVLLFLFKSDKYAPGLDLNRNKAISIAEKYLVDNGVDLGDEWNRLVFVSPSGPGKQNRFIWVEAGSNKGCG